MYVEYTSLSTATPQGVLKDITDLITGSVVTTSALSSSCDKINTTITQHVAPGWTFASTPAPNTAVDWTLGAASSNHTCAIYAFGLYIFCNGSGGISTSPDTINWTSRTSGFGTTAIRDIAYGANMLVAVGDSGKIATSVDGINWTLQTGPTGGTQINCITYAPWLSKFIIGDAAGRVSLSADGVTWTTATAVHANITICYSLNTNGTDSIVLGGYPTAYIATSADGITWTAPQALGTSTNSIQSVCYGNGLWVIGTSTGAVLVSTNKTSWTTPVASNTLFGSGSVTDIKFNNGMFVAVSPSATSYRNVVTSPDGYIWDQRYLPPSITTYQFNTICCNPSVGGSWVLGTSASGTNMITCPVTGSGYSSAIVKAPCFDEPSRYKFVRFFLNYIGGISCTVAEYYDTILTNTETFAIQSLANVASDNYYLYCTARGFLIDNSSTVPTGVAEITRMYAQDNISNGYPQWGRLTLNSGASAPMLNRMRHPTYAGMNGTTLGLSTISSLPTGKVKGSTLQMGLPFIPVYFVSATDQTGGELSSLNDIWFGPYSYASGLDQATNNTQVYSIWNPAGGTTAGVRYWIPIK